MDPLFKGKEGTGVIFENILAGEDGSGTSPLTLFQQRIKELGFEGLPGVGRELREGVTDDGTVVLEFLAFSGLDYVEFLTIRDQSL